MSYPPSRKSLPDDAIPLGVLADGYETLGLRARWLTESYFLTWDAKTGLWILWAKKDYWLPVEPVAAIRGVASRRPELESFLISSWSPTSSRTLRRFYPDPDSPPGFVL